MEKENEVDCCLKGIPEQDDRNDFCIPKICCPDRFPSAQHPSPTDCLPPEELQKVFEQIRDANELLLDLALADGRSPEETYQKVFDGLVGLRVEIANQMDETIEGRVTLVGYDFIALQEEEMTFMYPYSQIKLIKPCGQFAEPYADPELTEIDPCYRRDLTFHFGEVVSSSPELIHLFFRIRLNIYLLILLDKKIRVRVDSSAIEGLLIDVNKDNIILEVEGERKVILIDKILLITIKK